MLWKRLSGFISLQELSNLKIVMGTPGVTSFILMQTTVEKEDCEERENISAGVEL